MIRAELTKLKRSSLWLVAIVFPLLSLITGTLNFIANRETFHSNWSSFTSQVTLFYALFFFSFGIATLASAAWRMEHRGTNWNLLFSTGHKPIQVMTAKACGISTLVAFMQFVLVTSTILVGKLGLHIQGDIPLAFIVTGILSIIAAFPLVTLQSCLSMLTKSFAIPVALCVGGCVFGFASIASDDLSNLGYFIPQGLLTQTLALGSSSITNGGELSIRNATSIIIASIILSSVILSLSSLLVRKIKLN